MQVQFFPSQAAVAKGQGRLFQIHLLSGYQGPAKPKWYRFCWAVDLRSCTQLYCCAQSVLANDYTGEIISVAEQFVELSICVCPCTHKHGMSPHDTRVSTPVGCGIRGALLWQQQTLPAVEVPYCTQHHLLWGPIPSGLAAAAILNKLTITWFL